MLEKREAAYQCATEFLTDLPNQADDAFLRFNVGVDNDELCAFVSQNTGRAYVALSVAYDCAFIIVDHVEYGYHYFNVSLDEDYSATYEFLRQFA